MGDEIGSVEINGVSYFREYHEPIKLGVLIEKLEGIRKDKEVHFDFAYTRPLGLASFRGNYDELALGFCDSGKGMDDTGKTVADLLTELKEAIDTQFTGWKGGQFTMHENTPIWVANYGDAGNTAVVDVFDNYFLVLKTHYIRD